MLTPTSIALEVKRVIDQDLDIVGHQWENNPKFLEVLKAAFEMKNNNVAALGVERRLNKLAIQN